MRLIAHRGNIDGKNPERENSIDYIEEAIEAGYDVEIDVWWHNGKWRLGHDFEHNGKHYGVSLNWLSKHKNKLWCHAKNIYALFHLTANGFHTFYHKTDDVTLTTQNYLWTYPGKKPLTSISIAVKPESEGYTMEELAECAGICSDFISKYLVKESK